jgi:hypothetical protein
MNLVSLCPLGDGGRQNGSEIFDTLNEFGNGTGWTVRASGVSTTRQVVRKKATCWRQDTPEFRPQEFDGQRLDLRRKRYHEVDWTRDETGLVWVLNLAGGAYDSWWYDKTRPVTHRHILYGRDPQTDWLHGWMLRRVGTNAGLSLGAFKGAAKFWQTLQCCLKPKSVKSPRRCTASGRNHLNRLKTVCKLFATPGNLDGN